MRPLRRARGPSGIVTDHEGLWLANAAGGPERVEDHTRLRPSYDSQPGSFLPRSMLDERGWSTATAGWLVRAPQTLTPEDLATLRDFASREGLSSRDPRGSGT
ncbi:MAG TPA: hypothetical protein VM143_03325 [Acidimicrobiales bacterium]|nr:hypothetical protein [Acidimicrobiales bacterium]